MSRLHDEGLARVGQVILVHIDRCWLPHLVQANGFRGYMRSDPALAVSDTIVVMVPALVTRGGVGFRLVDLFPERHGFTVMVGSGRPLSRGWVLLRNNDPAAHPRIFPQYFSDPEDLGALARSVRRMRDMMGGLAIRDLIESELTPGQSLMSRPRSRKIFAPARRPFFIQAAHAAWAAIRLR